MRKLFVHLDLLVAFEGVDLHLLDSHLDFFLGAKVLI